MENSGKAIRTTIEQNQFKNWTVPKLMQKTIESYGNLPAAFHEGQSITFLELESRAAELAEILKLKGVGPDKFVAVCMNPGIDFYVAIIAILKAGGAYIPLDPKYPTERLQYIVDDADPTIILTSDSLSIELNRPETTIDITSIKADFFVEKDSSRNLLDSNIRPENLAYAIYTSGSTGRPKGVLLTHEGLCNLALAKIEIWNLGTKDRILQFASISFDASVAEIFAALFSGACLCFAPRGSVLIDDILQENLQNMEITCLTAPPMALSNLDYKSLPHLKNIAVAGEKCSVGLAKRICETKDFYNFYGPTEVTVMCATHKIDGSKNTPPPLGEPLTNCEMYALNSNLEAIRKGEVGDLYFAGLGLARGYLNQPGLTAEKFIPNPYGPKGSRMYKTGDLVRLTEDGELEYLGRDDGQFKLRGFRIEIGEIENRLSTHPSVRSIHVRPHKFSDGDHRIIAYIAPDLKTPNRNAESAITSANRHVELWRSIYEADSNMENGDPIAEEAQTRGWNSTYTGQPLDSSDMQSWVNETISRIQGLMTPNNRVLEIGCGYGLLMQKLIPDCKSYTGIDISSSELKKAHSKIPRMQRDKVVLLEGAAHQTTELSQGKHEIVIINSVLQYFPNIEYLEETIRQAIDQTLDGGFIFIGDVRSLPLLKTFATSVEAHQSAHLADINGLRERVNSRIKNEKELVVDPLFFYYLKQKYPRIGGIKIQPKESSKDNELSKYRYDVTLKVADDKQSSDSLQSIDSTEGLNLNIVLSETPNHGFLRIKGIKNNLLQNDQAIYSNVWEDKSTINDRQLTGQHPYDIVAIARSMGLSAEIHWSGPSKDFFFDLVVTRDNSWSKGTFSIPYDISLLESISPYDLATNPAINIQNLELESEIRRYARTQLPDFMLPSLYVFMDRLPLTANRKIDSSRLPIPELNHHDTQDLILAANDEVERGIVSIWSKILGKKNIPTDADFFRIGGHSLLATQVVSQINSTFNTQIPLKTVFQYRTIAELAQVVSKSRSSKSSRIQRLRKSVTALSFAQRRLWFLDKLAPGNPFYNVPMAFQVKGDLSISALKKAISSVLERHEILRSRYDSVDDEPMQMILSQESIEVKEVRKDNITSDEEIRSLLHSEAEKPFDLSTGPLIKFFVFYFQDQTIFLTIFHHIVADGWSLKILFDEICQYYDSYLRNESPNLPPLKIQYSDYAEWQNGEANLSLPRKREFWRRQLEGAPELLNLPLDKPRPPIQSYQGSTFDFKIPAKLLSKLHKFCEANDVTLFMTLMSCYQLLLSKYSGQTDICVGSPFANRTEEETEGLIGLFINMIVFRSNVAPERTFLDLLKSTKKYTIEALDNQDVPFEKVVEDISPQRSLSYEPLIQTMLVLQSYSTPNLEMSGVKLIPYSLNFRVSKVDLAIEFTESFGELNGMVEYNSDLFSLGTINRLVNNLVHLLSLILERPNSKFRDLNICMDSDLDFIHLAANGRTTKPYLDRTAVELLDKSFSEHSGRIAAEYGDQQISYQDLEKRSASFARRLAAAGVTPNDLVGLALPPGIDFLIAIIGIMRAGGAYVPIDLRYPDSRINYMLSDFKPNVLITSKSHASRFGDKVRDILFVEDAKYSTNSNNINLPKINPSNISYCIYTSGSTGKPKATLVTHRSLCNAILAEKEVFDMNENDRFLQLASTSFDASVSEIFLPLLSGACLCIPTSEIVLLGSDLEDEIRNLKITAFESVPAVLNDLNPESLSSVRAILVGGEKCPAKIAQNFSKRIRLINAYGPTEVTIESSTHLVDPQFAFDPPIGTPIPNVQMYILDDALNPVPVNAVGEIFVGGAGLAMGYLNQPAMTAEKFIPHPFQNGQRLYRTGDLGRLNNNGKIEYVGRRDHQVKIRGFRIELGEVENAIAAIDSVRHVVVTAKGKSEKELVAYLVPSQFDSRQEYLSKIKERLRLTLPEFMVPTKLFLVEELPLTSNGKIDLRKLEEFEHPISETTRDENLSPVEMEVKKIWQHYLQKVNISVYDDFFAVGGHSLMAVQIVSRIKALLAPNLTLKTFFNLRNIRSLSSAISNSSAGSLKVSALRNESSEANNYFPLSSRQELLYYFREIHPTSDIYIIPAVFEVNGNLDSKILKDAFYILASRHDALRTSFEKQGLEVYQKINPNAKPSWNAEVVKNPRADTKHLVETVIQEEFKRIFDLSQESQCRARLIEVSENRHILVITIHHIVSDGWSMNLLINDLFQIYKSLLKGLPIQEYNGTSNSTLIHKERSTLLSPDSEYLRTFWRQQLAGVSGILELPSDRPRPSKQTFHGGSYTFSLTNEQHALFNDLCKRAEITRFMASLGGLAILLRSLTGESDIVIGTTSANRTQDGCENTVGLFANLLPIRLKLNGQPTSLDFLLSVKNQLLSALEHEALPFEEILKLIKLKRDQSKSPLFQVNIIAPEINGLKLEDESIEFIPNATKTEISQYDLTLCLHEGSGNPSYEFIYNKDLFDRQTIERWAESYVRIIEDLSRHYHKHIPNKLFSKRELEIIEKWSLGKTEENELKSLNLMFDEQARRTPERLALVSDTQSLTYSDLKAKVQSLSKTLRSKGVRDEMPVALFSSNKVEVIISILAIIDAGGCYLPIDANWSEDRISQIFDSCNIGFALGDARQLDLLPFHIVNFIECIEIDNLDLLISAEKAQEEFKGNTTASSLAYIMFTSGTTGKPKGVLVTHEGIARLVLSSVLPEWKPGDSCLQASPLTFDASTYEIWAPLLNGGTLILMPEGFHALDGLTRALEKNVVTTLWLTSGLLNTIIDNCPFILKNVKRLLSGGDVLSASHIAKARQLFPDIKIYNGYGPTETTTFATVYQIEDWAERNSIPIGQPIYATEIRLVDSNMDLVPIGCPGELLIGGKGVARGYVKDPKSTAEKFVPNVFSKIPGQRLYRTGDFAKWRPDGSLDFLGRQDRQVKIRGFRIELVEVEAIIESLPQVTQCVVVFDRPEHRLIAYWICNKDVMVSDFNIKRAVKDLMPEFMVPAIFIEMDKFPLSENGKVDYNKIPNIKDYRAEVGDKEIEEPQNEQERALAQVWKEILGLPKIGRDESFFQVGGDSLRVLQIKAQIQKMGYDFEIHKFFSHPTIADLASILTPFKSDMNEIKPFELLESRDKNLISEKMEDAYPMTMLQQGMLFHSQFSEANILYHDIISYRLSLPLNMEKFNAVIELLTKKHEILRTGFNLSEYTSPVQIVYKSANIPITHTDLRTLDFENVETSIKTWLDGEVLTGFDWQVHPLLRLFVFEISDSSFQLSFSFHHAILDGWSIASLFSEFTYLYRDVRTSRPSESPRLKSKFSYTVNRELKALASEAERSFWLTHTSQFQLKPLSKKTQQKISSEFKRGHVHITHDLSDSLKRVAKQNDVPLKTVLLSAHLKVLSVYFNTNKVSTGVVHNCRQETQDGDKVLGLFLNSLPFCFIWSGSSWSEIFSKVAESERELFNHRHYPLAKIIQDKGGKSIFHVLFNFINFHILSTSGAHQVSEYSDDRSRAQSSDPISVDFLINEDGKIECDFFADPNFFDEDDISKLIDIYEKVLKAVSSDNFEIIENEGLIETAVKIEELPRNPVSFSDPETFIEKVLVELMEEIFMRKNIGVNDDFFSLGGHSIAAVRFMGLVRQRLNLHVPIAILYSNPRIKDLAIKISDIQNGKSENSAMVELESTDDANAVVLVHPVGGDILCYQQLAKQLGKKSSVWAFRRPEIGAHKEPQDVTIESLAQTYLTELVLKKPQGPYRIIGWSMGGVIAYEMALRLKSRGLEVQFIGLIDSALNIPLETRRVLSQTFYDKIYQTNAKALSEYVPASRLESFFYFSASKSEEIIPLDKRISDLKGSSNATVETFIFDADHDSIVTGSTAEALSEQIQKLIERK